MSAGRSRVAASCIVFGVLLSSSVAHADPREEAARAQKLFEDALKLMEAKSFESACPMLAESFALDPAGGTALDLGFCWEHAGRLATALHAYERAREIAEADGRTDRSIAAHDRILELDRVAGHVRLVVPVDTWRAEKWHAFVDGLPLASNDLTVPFPVDRGAHVVTITAENKRTFERNVAVNDGMTTDVVVDALVDARPASIPLHAHQEARPASPVFTIGDDVPRRNWGIAVGSVGIAGLGVGTVAAIAAASLHAESNRECPASGCTGDGVDAEKRADGMAWVSNVSFIAGAALVGAGAYLFLSARHARRVPTTSTLLTGRFAFDLP